jgi:hypothetical protein
MWAFRTLKNTISNMLSDRFTHSFSPVTPVGWALPTTHTPHCNYSLDPSWWAVPTLQNNLTINYQLSTNYLRRFCNSLYTSRTLTR